MPSVNQEDEFTEVTRKRKKRKATSSPTLPSTLQRIRPSEQLPKTPALPKPTYKNTIPVIFSSIDAKFQNWRSVMGELRQHHPSLKISQIKELAKGGLLVVGDSPQDAVILQIESKMKAALGINVRISLPKAYQISQKQSKCLAVKRVPTDMTETDFKEFLDLNKVCYAKAERLESKKDGRVLPIFQLEVSDPAEAEALLSQNLMCNVTGIVYKVEEFRFGSASTANVSDIGTKLSPNKNVSSVVRTIHTKDAQKKKQNGPSVPTVQGHILHLTRGVPNIKSRHSGNMWSTTKKPMPPQ